MVLDDKKVDYLVVDTTAFIENAPLQNIANKIVTVQEVVNEITSKRQLRRLVVLPYDFLIKDVFPENIRIITEFAQKTGDYPNLSATDIKVMALTYQLEKAEVGVDHIRTEPFVRKSINVTSKHKVENVNLDISGFFMPKQEKSASRNVSESEGNQSESEDLSAQVGRLELENNMPEDKPEIKREVNCGSAISNSEENLILPKQTEAAEIDYHSDTCNSEENLDDLILPKQTETDEIDRQSDATDSEDQDDDIGWITPSNIHTAKKHMNSGNLEEKSVKVACVTTDFAMQNVLKQMNLNVSALDGRIIKQLKTYILRCYTCFKTTSIMTQRFCPKCGNETLKRVSVSVNSKGKQKIHINARYPLTARGKKFSLPTVQGGKHSKNPILSADQRLPDQKPTRLARTKNNPMDDCYIAGYSPFIMRDINSKSAQLGIRNAKEVKHWMKKNPNETCRKRK